MQAQTFQQHIDCIYFTACQLQTVAYSDVGDNSQVRC